MQIDILPPELHSHIVSFTCSSQTNSFDLPAAHALALVSRYWSSVAQPYKYHTLRVSGPRALRSLLTRLESLPEPHRRVRRLSLADRPLCSPPSSGGMTDEEVLYAEKAVISRLILLLSPTLHELELHLSNTFFSTAVFAGIWSHPFPQLLSLSLHGYYPFPISPAPDSDPNFPRLGHLSLDGVSNPYGLLAPGALCRTAPHLATLEVRGLRCAPAFAKEVASAVTAYDIDSQTGPLPQRLPQTLASLTLYLTPDMGPKSTRRSQTLHAQMRGVLEALAKRPETAKRLDVQVVNGCLVHDKTPCKCSHPTTATCAA
ncbi:hypothetical protein M0805_008625 [Coniferiporia weirii]|nr:hypothetical protein M0805_008625 [Coniferiporia weirii]